MMIQITGFEARGLAQDIIRYLEFIDIEIPDDVKEDVYSDLKTLLRFHGGLHWDDTNGNWVNPDTRKPMKFNSMTLRCVPMAEGE